MLFLILIGFVVHLLQRNQKLLKVSELRKPNSPEADKRVFYKFWLRKQSVLQGPAAEKNDVCKVWLQKKILPIKTGFRKQDFPPPQNEFSNNCSTCQASEKKSNRPCRLEKKCFKPPRLRKAQEELHKSKSSPFRSSFCLRCLHWKVMKVGKYTCFSGALLVLS